MATEQQQKLVYEMIGKADRFARKEKLVDLNLLKEAIATDLLLLADSSDELGKGLDDPNAIRDIFLKHIAVMLGDDQAYRAHDITAQIMRHLRLDTTTEPDMPVPRSREFLAAIMAPGAVRIAVIALAIAAGLLLLAFLARRNSPVAVSQPVTAPAAIRPSASAQAPAPVPAPALPSPAMPSTTADEAFRTQVISRLDTLVKQGEAAANRPGRAVTAQKQSRPPQGRASGGGQNTVRFLDCSMGTPCRERQVRTK